MENATDQNRTALRQSEEVVNQITAGWFAGSMVFIMLIFAIIRWTRFFFMGFSKNSRESAVLRSLVAGTRYVYSYPR